MKKKTYGVLLLIMSIISFSFQDVHAQSFQLGGGAGISDGYTYYRVRSGIPGFTIRGSYLFNDFLEGSASATLFLPNKEYLQDEDGDRRTLVWMLDFDLHYIFATLGTQWSFYGLAGFEINFLSSKYLGEETFPNNYTDNYPGLNLGIGSSFLMRRKNPLYAEMKYTLGKFHQWSLSIGVLFDTEGLFKK